MAGSTAATWRIDVRSDGEGELYITGRVKDLIIKGGRNLVPQEIEDVVGGIDGIRKGCVAAFGIADETSGTERLIVLAESHTTSSDERDRLEHEAIARVASQVGLPPDVVCIVPPGVVPKTPSGKIRRAAAREAYEAGRISGRRLVPFKLRLGLALGAVAQTARRVARRVGRVLQATYLIAVWSLALAAARAAVSRAHIRRAGGAARALVVPAHGAYCASDQRLSRGARGRGAPAAARPGGAGDEPHVVCGHAGPPHHAAHGLRVRGDDRDSLLARDRRDREAWPAHYRRSLAR